MPPRRAILVEGNNIGTDVSGTLPLGNEIDGIIFSTNASNNTIGGTAGGQGNTSRSTWRPASSSSPGTGDSILSNSIYSNGDQGIVLTGTANNAQTAPISPALLAAAPAAMSSASLTSVASTNFLDPVLQQPGRRSLGFWPGPDVPRLDHGDDQRRPASPPSISISPAGWPSEPTSPLWRPTRAPVTPRPFPTPSLRSRSASRSRSRATRSPRRPGQRRSTSTRSGNLNVAVSVELCHVQRLRRRGPGLHGDLGHA